MKFLALGLLYGLAAVYSAPLLFNNDLLTKGHAGLAVLHHASFAHNDETHCANGTYLRYLYLVPTTAQKSYLADGFASGALGYQPVVHSDLTPDFAAGEMMTELVGLSNCKTWQVALVGFWANGYHTYKYLGGLKEGSTWKRLYFAGLDALVNFVHDNLSLEHFKGLVAKGVVAGDFMLKLNALFAGLL